MSPPGPGLLVVQSDYGAYGAGMNVHEGHVNLSPSMELYDYQDSIPQYHHLIYMFLLCCKDLYSRPDVRLLRRKERIRVIVFPSSN